MKRFYHKLMCKTFQNLWSFWHKTLRRKFCRRDRNGRPDYHQMFEDRPWYHLCCNGDEGGWRTDVCDYLEGTWRRHEEELYEIT